jgi:O-antigen/teichoic acid export membrane protein
MASVAQAAELRRSTKSGAIGLVGAAVNGAFGFVLTTVIVRTFGADGSGALFTAIGIISIVGVICCLGADTALMWAIPRNAPTPPSTPPRNAPTPPSTPPRGAASSSSAPRRSAAASLSVPQDGAVTLPSGDRQLAVAGRGAVASEGESGASEGVGAGDGAERGAEGAGRDAARLLTLAVLPTLGLSLVVAVVGFLGAGSLARVLLDEPDGAGLVRLTFAAVPVFVVSTVLLAAVRATRPVSAYVGVQFLLVPIARPVLVIAAMLAGGGVLLGFAGWLLPLLLALIVALLLVVRPLGIGAGATLRPRAEDWPRFWGFALPRAASVAIDASSMWAGVLLTGALSTRAEAGVFAAAGRYALAGLLIMQGLRVAVAPQLSRLLGGSRRAEAAAVYRRTTLMIVVLSWPAYLLLAIFAPAFLALFGAEFAAGAGSLAVLAAAMLVNVGVGLVQTVLLMSGNSRGHLLAAVCGLALNLAACVVLIPEHGALGAAVAWSLGIVGENVLAAILARRALGEPLFSRTPVLAAAGVGVVTGLAALTGTALFGRGPAGLAVALGILVAVALPLAPRARKVLA